jgi:hypothetical protein
MGWGQPHSPATLHHPLTNTYLIGGWVGPTDSLDISKSLIPQSSGPYPSHYTISTLATKFSHSSSLNFMFYTISKINITSNTTLFESNGSNQAANKGLNLSVIELMNTFNFTCLNIFLLIQHFWLHILINQSWLITTASKSTSPKIN